MGCSIRQIRFLPDTGFLGLFFVTGPQPSSTADLRPSSHPIPHRNIAPFSFPSSCRLLDYKKEVGQARIELTSSPHYIHLALFWVSVGCQAPSISRIKACSWQIPAVLQHDLWGASLSSAIHHLKFFMFPPGPEVLPNSRHMNTTLGTILHGTVCHGAGFCGDTMSEMVHLPN